MHLLPFFTSLPSLLQWQAYEIKVQRKMEMK